MTQRWERPDEWRATPIAKKLSLVRDHFFQNPGARIYCSHDACRAGNDTLGEAYLRLTQLENTLERRTAQRDELARRARSLIRRASPDADRRQWAQDRAEFLDLIDEYRKDDDPCTSS